MKSLAIRAFETARPIGVLGYALPVLLSKAVLKGQLFNFNIIDVGFKLNPYVDQFEITSEVKTCSCPVRLLYHSLGRMGNEMTPTHCN